VYVLICSLIGSLTVVACKALGIALKLTLRGSNQLFKRETLAFACVVLVCVIIQMNYLNKVRGARAAGEGGLRPTPTEALISLLARSLPSVTPSHARRCCLAAFEIVLGTGTGHF
jgi:hypothetical protein